MANNNKRTKNNRDNTVDLEELFKNNNLEMLTAALLLSGKLRVNSIQLARAGTLSVVLFGEFLKELSSLIDVDQKELKKLFKYND